MDTIIGTLIGGIVGSIIGYTIAELAWKWGKSKRGWK